MKVVRLRHTEAWGLCCDHCGEQVMCSVKDGALIISDRRHGEDHVLVIPIAELDKLAELALVSV